MVYHVIGVMSGSSMDGLDVADCVLEEIRGRWTYRIPHATCIPFDAYWQKTLATITELPARELLRAHTAFGAWMGEQIQQFIEIHQLEHKIHLVASHGHTVFHEPQHKLSFQLGDGAAMAVRLQLPVVSDLRNMDIALGGQGAPIVPMAERLLWPDTSCFLNIGGISNIALHQNDKVIGFDVCPANRILNALAQEVGLPYDAFGKLASEGSCIPELLASLNDLPYYTRSAPKSLANEMGLQEVLPLLSSSSASVNDRLHTYVMHIVHQVNKVMDNFTIRDSVCMLSGGGARNTFLVEQLQAQGKLRGIDYRVPDEETIDYKEALAMALLGVLRWREEETVLASVTGAERASVGGSLWMGQV